MDSTLIILNILLIGGFATMAYETFKHFNPWAAISMLTTLGILIYINGV